MSSIFSLPAAPTPASLKGLANVSGVIGIGSSLLTLLPKGAQNTFDSLGKSTGALQIQATLEEVHSASVEVTEHPVQVGAAITDHSFNRPGEVVLRCAWSNSGLSGLISAATNLFGEIQSGQNLFAIASGGGSAGDYVTGVFTQLTALKEARVPFDIITSLKHYQNMLITQLHVTRDVKSVNALICTVTCKEIILVDVLTGQVQTQNQSQAQTTATVAASGSQALTGFNGVSVPSTLPTANWVNTPFTLGTS